MSKKTASEKTKKQRTKAGRPSLQDTDDTRAALLESAIEHFAKKGFAGTSVKDIAESAGVNISLVSYHFAGKEGLYKTCLLNFGKNRLATVERLLQAPQTIDEARFRLEMFVDDMIIWFDEEPELCAMVQREANMGFPVARDVFEATFLKIFSTFMSFIKTGQAKSFLRSDLDPQIVASLFFGGLMSMIKKDEITKRTFGVSVREPAYRKKLKSQVCLFFYEGLVSREPKSARGVRR